MQNIVQKIDKNAKIANKDKMDKACLVYIAYLCK